MVSRSETLASSLFNSIFPDECRVCEKPLTGISRVPVCAECLALPAPLQMEYFCSVCRIPFANSFALDEDGRCPICSASTSSFDAVYAFGAYEGVLQKLIQLFKYGKVESLADPLARLLLRALPFGETFDVVMPIPMHWRKQWQRGFNQAELLAEPLARRYGLKVSGQLQRVGQLRAQASLDEQDRHSNMRKAFRVQKPGQLAGQRVLLVDDVLTTGATLRSAAAVLKACGAKRVTALTLARVDRRAYSPDVIRLRQRASRPSDGVEVSSASSMVADERKSQTASTGAR